MFRFCWEMFCVHQVWPGAEWKFSECKRRKVSILPPRRCRPCNIVGRENIRSADGEKSSFERHEQPFHFSSTALSFWPGAPYIFSSLLPLLSTMPSSTNNPSPCLLLLSPFDQVLLMLLFWTWPDNNRGEGMIETFICRIHHLESSWYHLFPIATSFWSWVM